MGVSARTSHVGRLPVESVRLAHPRRLRRAAILLVGLAFAVLVAREALVATWEQDHPDRALALRSDDAVALTAAAEAKADSPTTAGAAAAERLAAASLARQPLNATALRVMSEAAAAQGQAARAYGLLLASTRLSRRDLRAEAALYGSQILRGDAPGAVETADALLRVEPRTQATLFPSLGALAGIPVGQKALSRELGLAPPWRTPFLNALARNTPDPALASDVLTRLAAGPAPPTPDEVAPVLTRYVDTGRYLDAFLIWRQFAPLDQPGAGGAVRDGDFAGLNAAAPFVWTTTTLPGATVEMPSGPTLERARNSGLHVQYDGISTGVLAQQLLVLPPGAFRFSGRVYVRDAVGQTRLAWSLVCAGTSQGLMTTPDTPLAPGWNDFSAVLNVPANGCEGQWLRLSPTPGERPTDIEVWYGDFRVRRAIS